MTTQKLTIEVKGRTQILECTAYRRHPSSEGGAFEARTIEGDWMRVDPERNPVLQTNIIPNTSYQFESEPKLKPDKKPNKTMVKPDQEMEVQVDQALDFTAPAQPEKKMKVYTEDDHLNNICNEIVDQEYELQNAFNIVRRQSENMFRIALLQGKIVSDNLEYITTKLGGQRQLAELVGLSESQLSNRKSAYEKLKAESGDDDPDQLIGFLKTRQIAPTMRNIERMKSLLAAPAQAKDGHDQRSKDDKRLEELSEEMDEIHDRNLPRRPETSEDAKRSLRQLEDLRRAIADSDYLSKPWVSKTYRNFIKGFGIDMVTGEAAPFLEIHHTSASGGSGPMGDKLNDLYGIPVSPATHDKIESGKMTLDPIVILSIQFRCLASFIAAHVDSDEIYSTSQPIETYNDEQEKEDQDREDPGHEDEDGYEEGY